MENFLIIVGIVALIGVGFFVYQSFKSKAAPEEKDTKLLFDYLESLRKEVRESNQENRKEVEAKLDKINDRLAKGLETSTSTIQKQFAQSATLVKELTEELTKIKETNKQVLNFSGQLQSLENILTNPKKRGILGEYFLDSLLAQVFQPNQYKMQYSFSNGEIVDAAIFFKDKIIPIDAKFSLEKYNLIMEEHDEKKREKLEKEFKMDIKNRIDETSKYIRPKDNTTEFAFMFIPAEGVYYNLLVYKVGDTAISSKDLINYAFEKHVIIVSPTSLFAYLQTVIQGLKGLQIEESIKIVLKKIFDLNRHIINYDDHFKKLGGHLGTTVNAYNNASHELSKIDKDIFKITSGEAGGKMETILLDKPSVDA